MSNEYGLLVRRLGPASQEDLNQVDAYHAWAAASSPLYFLLDEHAADVLNTFEEQFLRDAARDAVTGTATSWYEQIKPLLREMRRMVDE